MSMAACAERVKKSESSRMKRETGRFLSLLEEKKTKERVMFVMIFIVYELENEQCMDYIIFFQIVAKQI